MMTKIFKHSPIKLSFIIYHLSFSLALCLMFTGCGLYQKYEKTVQDPTDVFGSVTAGVSEGDGTSIAQTSWREFFSDPYLQQLIEQALANNTDLNTARINIEKSEAQLKSAKLAYLPSLYFSPQGSLSSFDNAEATKAYNLQMQASMDLDVFGSITSKKRAAKAAVLQAQMSEEATRSNLISTLAQQYYKLMLLDRELEILTLTDSLWKASLDTQQALYENGKSYSTAVNQQESSWLSVKTQIVDIRRGIRATENAICSILCITPQHIEREHWGAENQYHTSAEDRRMFENRYLRVGVPALMLELRPDIRLANYCKLLWQAVASLSQPLFARGQIKANYKISQLTEENLKKKYVQTVINAGNDVNEAIADCQAAREKHDYYHRQVEVLYEAYTGTHELMDNGKASYLEVLTAQESLLSAQLSEAENLYSGAQAVIALYIALGGGTK